MNSFAPATTDTKSPALALARYLLKKLDNAERLLLYLPNEDWVRRTWTIMPPLELVWPVLECLQGFADERARVAYELAVFYKVGKYGSSATDEVSYQYFRKAQFLCPAEPLRWHIDEEMGFLLYHWSLRLQETSDDPTWAPGELTRTMDLLGAASNMLHGNTDMDKQTLAGLLNDIDHWVASTNSEFDQYVTENR